MPKQKPAVHHLETSLGKLFVSVMWFCTKNRTPETLAMQTPQESKKTNSSTTGINDSLRLR